MAVMPLQKTARHLPSASAAIMCGTCGCMHIDTTGQEHASAASGGGGRGGERWRTVEVEKQPMTVGETMKQQLPQDDTQTSLQLRGRRQEQRGTHEGFVSANKVGNRGGN